MTMTDVSRAAAIDAPLLQTELPGPIAASIIARDERVTSPSLTRLYPLVVRRGRGCVIEDVGHPLILAQPSQSSAPARVAP